MIALLDNLTAIIIGMTVFFLIVAMNAQMSQATLERAVHYSAKRQAIETGNWIQEDVANIGAGVSIVNAGAGGAIVALEEQDDQTHRFTFRRKLSAGAAAVATVSYELERSDTLQVIEDGQQRTLQLYQLVRKVDGQTTGRSMKSLATFNVELLDIRGEVTQNMTQAAQIRVRFSTAARYIERQKFISRNYWATTVPLRATNG